MRDSEQVIQRFDIWSSLSVYMKRSDCGRRRILFCNGCSPAERVHLVDGEGSVGFYPWL